MISSLKNIKSSCQLWLRRHFVKIKSIDELYQDVQKLSPIPKEIIYTPELEKIPISKNSLKYIQKDKFVTPDIYSITLSNAIYYAKYETVMSKDRQIIAESMRNPSKFEKFSLRTTYLKKTEKISGFCSVFRSHTNYKNYYHSLIDYIPRVYLLNQPEYRDIPKIKLLVSSPLTKIEKFFLSKLLPKNVVIKIVNPENIYTIEKLIFPSFLCTLKSGYLPEPYLNYFSDKFIPKREAKKTHRIFISRKPNNHGRCLLNEDDLLPVLEKYGFSRYYPEEFSFEEQIELFYDAEIVIGVHGYALVNLIFSRKIKVLELCSTDKIITNFYLLSKSVGNNHEFLQNTNPAKKHYDDYYLDISKLSNYLESFLD